MRGLATKNDDAPLAGEAHVHKSKLHQQHSNPNLIAPLVKASDELLPRLCRHVFVVPTPAARDALTRLGLDAVSTEDVGGLDDADHAIVLAAVDRLMGAGKVADLIESRGGRASVAQIPRGARGVAEAVFTGVTAAEFLEVASNPVASRESKSQGAGPRHQFRPFPIDAMPEPLATFIEAGATAIGCDASFIALPLLSALGAAIGNTRRLRLKNSWHVPSITWTAIVGESGTHKSPAFGLALRPVREAQDRAFADHADAVKVWEVGHAKWERKYAAWKRDENTDEPPPEPAEPTPRRYLVGDTTVEALAPLLLHNPRGLLVAHDELSGWLTSFDRYSGSGRVSADAAHWLSMHDGSSMTVDRKTGSQTIHVPSAFVCVTGGIQPGILARAMTSEHHENGLLARFLFAMPPRRARRWTDADINQNLVDAVVTVFEKLFALVPEKDADGHDQPVVVTLTPEAKLAWIEFFNAQAHEQASMAGDLAAAWSKLESYAARLALVIHEVRVAAGDTTVASPGMVDEASIAAGVTLARWFGDEARRVYGALNESDAETERRKLLEWISLKGGIVSVRDLTHGQRRFRNQADAAEDALNELVELGNGHWRAYQNPRGGPTAMRFLLNATVTRTPTDDPVARGFGDGDTRRNGQVEGTT